MSSERDRLNNQVRETICSLSDESLLRMLESDQGDYTPFALDIAQQELSRRGGKRALSQHRSNQQAQQRLSATGRQQISSDDTKYIGVFFVVLTMLAIVFYVASRLKNETRGANQGILIVVFLALVLGILPLVFWSRSEGIRVSIDEDFVYVADSKKEVKIPFSNFKEVLEDRGRIETVSIYLKSPSEFGDEITFIPIARSCLLGGDNPIARLLRHRMLTHQDS